MPRSALDLIQRLFLLVAIALLPAVLLLVAAVAELRSQREAAAQDQARRILADAAARQERMVEGMRQTLLVLAEANSVQTGNLASCARRFGVLARRIPDQVVIGTADLEGWVLCSTAATPPRTVFIGDRRFHRLPLETGGFVVGEYEPGSVLRPGSLPMGLPIRPVGGGEPLGTVGAALGAEWMAKELRPIGLPPGAELFVVDRNDRVLVRIATPRIGAAESPPGPDPGEPAPEWLRRRLAPAREAGTAPPDTAADAEAGPRVLEVPGPDGAARLLAVEPYVAGTGGALRMAVSLDAAAALAPVAATERDWVVLVTLGLVASLLAAWFGARSFLLRPIAALQETARRWAAGDYSARAAPELRAGVPELTRLATALDQVAAAAEERDRAAAALMEKEARLSLALEAGALGAWEMDPRTGAVIRSPRHDALFGYDRPVAAWTYRFMLRHVLREDRPKVEAIFRRAVAASAPLHAECRIRRAGDGEVRWLEATGAPHRGPDGRVKYLGVIADVTERRRAEEQLRLVAGELNHRVKNSLAAVQSIAAQTLRWPEDDAPGAAAARAAFEARLLALARSHDLLTREGWSGAGLADVAARALAPHAAAKGTAPAGEATETRVRIAGPPVRLSPRSAIPLAMALHELATNAARHGALSVPQGRVAVTWSLVPKDPGEGEPRLLLRWRESGGPALAGPPARRGFGSRLLERGLALELCGTVRMDFAPGGLVCEIEAPLSIVAPSDAVAAVLAAMTAPGAATAAPPRMPAVAAAAAR